MVPRYVRLLLLLICAATVCHAQVTLNFAQPATATAGGTIDNLLGSGFPTGTISPADVTVGLASSCHANFSVTITALSITQDVHSNRQVGFALPLPMSAGTYAVAVYGKTQTGVVFGTNTCTTLTVVPQTNFVKVNDKGQLTLGGKLFQFAGGNVAGLVSTDSADTDQLLGVAQKNQFQVVRIWSFIDIGTLSGSGSVAGPENGWYNQYWAGSEPAFNDGPTGLRHLDYAVYRAGQMGMKVVMTLTNNWTPGGGMDQYVSWAGDQYHDQFYTDPKIINWYQGWVSHLLNHVNYYTGKAYKDDATIMTWELANEPRCQGTGDYPTSPSCSTTTLVNWAAQQAAFVKTIDQNHLVSVGDEGPFCSPSTKNNPNAYDGCAQGDDAVAFAEIPDVDMISMHLYTQALGNNPTYGTEYIEQHITLGRTVGKPAYLGEYGLTIGNQRNLIYNQWEQTVMHFGGAGAMVWSLSGGEPGPIAAEAETNLALADQAPLLQTIRNFAQETPFGNNLYFDPVADDQWGVTTLNTPITINPIQNVLAYGTATVDPTSLNLNPGGPAKSTAQVFGGQFTASNGSVSFTPDTDFNGTAVAPFTVKDSKGSLSNTAYMEVTVNPTDNVTYEIESFETGSDGWQGGGDTTTQSTQYATNGPHSLKVVATQSSWFGIFFASPISLVNRPYLSLDIVNTGTSGASADLVIQTGNNYQWCQSNAWPWLSPNTPTTISMPLTPAGTGCASPDLGQIDAIYVYLAAGNTYYIDNLRAGAVPVALQPIVIASFEDGIDGWGPQSSGGGTVAQENTFYTDGAYGLQVNSTSNGWFGNGNLPSLDLSSKSGIAFDIDTPNNGTSVNMQLYFGPNNTYCQGTNWGWADSSLSTEVIPFSTLSCAGGVTPDLTQVTGLYLFFLDGTYYIDNVRAQ